MNGVMMNRKDFYLRFNVYTFLKREKNVFMSINKLNTIKNENFLPLDLMK